MPERPSNSALLRPRNPARTFPLRTFCLLLLMLYFTGAPASAEVRVVLSQSEFRMGDRDTREDATRLAIEAAKRNALEQVATYLESVTVVEGTDITKDEIRSYSAGLILVLDQQAGLWLDGDHVVVTIDLTSQIDTDEVAQAILALRENESARHQLATLRNEIDDLQKELEASNQLLATAATAEEALQASLQRQDLLDRVQSNAMVSQAWTDWVVVGPYGYPASWGGSPTYGLLNAARGLYPANPHIGVAQQVIVMNPPAPQASPPATQPALRQPGMRPVPLTLNEISHTTSTQPVHLGNPLTGAHVTVPSTNARSVPSLQQFLEPPGAGGPSSGQHAPSSGSPSARSLQQLQQFLQPPATTPSSQVPVTRRLPPTVHQHLPSIVVPRGSFHIGPRGLGGQYGAGRGGYGGYSGYGGGGHGGGRGR